MVKVIMDLAGTFKVNLLPFNFAAVNGLAITVYGTSNVLISVKCFDVKISPDTFLNIPPRRSQVRYTSLVGSILTIDKVIKIDDSPALNAIATLNGELRKTRQASSRAVYAAVDRISTLTTGFAIVIGAVLGALVAILIWFTAFRLGRPLRRMTHCMSGLAGGDNFVNVPALGQGDEIGEMAQAVQVFKENAVEMARMAAEKNEARDRKSVV